MEEHPSKPGAPPRKSFSLTGPSTAFDPQRHAVRADLADVRLADLVFAPHYAAPMACVVSDAAPLHLGPGADSPSLVQLTTGDCFETLDMTGDMAWGIATAAGLVGYVNRAVLTPGLPTSSS